MLSKLTASQVVIGMTIQPRNSFTLGYLILMEWVGLRYSAAAYQPLYDVSIVHSPLHLDSVRNGIVMFYWDNGEGDDVTDVEVPTNPFGKHQNSSRQF
ncbi:hypothetical protein PanWU01x14_180750 [Parasponia andersonii]|uniref:Uncharacterized protein n=1 Tax=Parasponia andersonii TaxID=3476 RepID=A0A2P5C642_PARAD|nr:hypothetical protein PanWU01x14_180750 [Parasponia andersonii]